jgi:hypothetical protein
VGRRIRVGVFSTDDICLGSELNFDYQWQRSNRPPTKVSWPHTRKP